MKHYDFVTVGNYTKDTIVSAAGMRYVDGGGYSYAARAARLLGIRVAAITRRAAEDAGVTAPLSDVGIDVYAYDSPSSTLMRLEYPTANVDERILSATLGTIAAAVKAEAVERTALILVGEALGAEAFRDSALYSAGYDRRFRGQR